ncbi:MAG TPA: hypothetical protein VMD74_05085 [Candidatus Methylomirabilis sp.]|nr:hypothetical protein [Candidatus Methylomirabilis sp.]
MKVTKTALTEIISITVAVLALLYIGWDTWRDFKNVQLKNTASQWYAQAFLDISAAAEKCQQVPLNLGNGKTMDIVSVDCLKQAANQTPATTPGATPTTPETTPTTPNK